MFATLFITNSDRDSLRNPNFSFVQKRFLQERKFDEAEISPGASAFHVPLGRGWVTMRPQRGSIRGLFAVVRHGDRRCTVKRDEKIVDFLPRGPRIVAKRGTTPRRGSRKRKEGKRTGSIDDHRYRTPGERLVPSSYYTRCPQIAA